MAHSSQKEGISVKRTTVITIFFCLIATLVQGDWPQWRGPEATGVAPNANPPTEWAEDRNIRWKLGMPGKGHATPIVWGDMVFVVTAIETDRPAKIEPESRRRGGRRRGNVQPTKIVKFDLLAIDRKRGEILWRQTAREELPHEGTHADGSWASNSPVTDGEHVYVYFGSRGLYCYDMQGNLRWEKDLGDMSTRNGFGEGSSPALHGDQLVLNWDHEGPSFIVALDKYTGEERWRKDRDEVTSWSTPIIVEYNGKAQVVASATNLTRGYDLATGKLIWQCGGMTANAIPSPVAANGIIYVTSGFRGNALQAIRLADAKGDITNTEAVAWAYDQDTPYVPSPLLYGDTLYFLKHNKAILTCFNAETGEPHYGPQRLEGLRGVYASPVGAADRVYVVDRNGTTLVIKHGAKFEVLATNSLDDNFDASPAIVDSEIYLRGHRYLYCIASN